MLVSAGNVPFRLNEVNSMKLSTRCRYGTRALVEIARNYGGGPTKRKDIARAQGLSQAYLENILSVLKSQGLVKTTRGADGGFVLSKAPTSITMLDIVQALEGSIAPVDCLDDPTGCDRAGRCGARKAWKKLHDAQVKVLSGITLMDLVSMDDGKDGGDFAI
jgi:Rrf2 family protein